MLTTKNLKYYYCFLYIFCYAA